MNSRAERWAREERKDRAQSLIQSPAMRLRVIARKRAELDAEEAEAQAEYDRLAAIIRAPLGSPDDVDL